MEGVRSYDPKYSFGDGQSRAKWPPQGTPFFWPELIICIWRTKPLRGGNKGWCTPAFLFWYPSNLVLKSLGCQGLATCKGSPDWNPIDNLFCSGSGSVLQASIQNWINAVNSHVLQLYLNFGLTLIRNAYRGVLLSSVSALVEKDLEVTKKLIWSDYRSRFRVICEPEVRYELLNS